MNPNTKRMLMIMLVIVFGMMLFGSFFSKGEIIVPYDNAENSFLTLVKDGYVTEVEQEQSGKLLLKITEDGEKALDISSGTSVTSAVPGALTTDIRADITSVCAESGAKCQNEGQGPTISGLPPSDDGLIQMLISVGIPILVILGIFWYIMKKNQQQNNNAMNFGRSRARHTHGKSTVRFSDVAGVEEAKQELQEIVEFLKYPEKFNTLGAKMPRGALLVGPPGCGKTLIARAVAGEAGASFFSISGSEFVEMFVGVGAARVRDLFEQARKNSPAIVFVDEIDAVGRQRGSGLGGSHDEREQTLNQILVEMDGFEQSTNIIVLAATNRPDILDPALLRPGRFDRQVIVDKPDLKGRLAIFQVHARGKLISKEVDLEELARQCPGFSGADIAGVVNEAAILSARRNLKLIGMSEFLEAIERAVAGPERKSRIISDSEKLIIAYHESGHAVVQRILPKCDPVAKVTIISRGMTLGYTMALPTEDRYLRSQAEFEDQIAGLLGGNVAERMIFGDVTTGASNDIEKATEIARNMVMQYGMSESLGTRTFGKRDSMIFLGRDISEQRNYSEEVAKLIDEEIKKILDRGRERARETLTQYKDRLETLVQKLLVQETVYREEFEKIFADLPPKENSHGKPKLQNA